ncbi:Jojoba acyl CoA reductase-related male sterility protein [Actinidia rufa]|uniref:Fatty acyl-CoA reductase n=1 Tax=Actinidia rufa TaxID=165716 RepID=A0A7J0E2L5_9ERIC|nr:Jojoba acyl CoA reductase-related male sterility protein [Actinidia rufa]
MGAFSLPSFSVSPKKVVNFSVNHDWCLLKRKKSVVYCQSSGNTVKSTVVSSVLTERSALVDAGSLVLSTNGKNQPEIEVKDLVPFGGPNTSVLEMDDGIGIVKFLRGKSFLITGATGFLAKVLIEKILRTVPDVGNIFLLIKAKSKEAAMQRLKNEIIDTELFKCLRQTYGKSYEAFMLSKLVPVLGNVCESNLGLEENTVEAIAKEVNIIVNSAANTTFDERYDVALDINTGGPSRLMSLAKKCKKLKLFLQVSTAYVNGQRQGRIMEKPFGIGDSIARENLLFETQKTPLPTLRVEDELKLVLDSKGTFDDNSVAQKMKELGLERMMDPIVLYYGKGQLTGFLVDPNGVLDVVPADMVVNATLAAIAKHGSAGKPESNVYQIASSVVNPLVFQDLASLLYQHFKSAPCLDSKGRPVHVPTMKLFGSMEDFSSHLWRDAVGRSGLSSVANGKLSQKLENICRKFDNSNTKRLMECMSEEEQQEFGFDVGNIDWEDYISNVHIPGLRKHVMKGRGMCT